MLTEQKYYEYMGSFKKNMSFEEIHQKWFACFDYILRSFKVDFTEKSIKSLFYNWEMNNWDLMRQGNSPAFKNSKKKELISAFCYECSYISDRTSYDRLFKTHWLFKKAFQEELYKLV